MIAVTFALPTESSTFTKLLAAAQISSADVHVIHTGVGRTASERTIRAFLAAHSPALLISSGFAGALTSELKVGDVFLAENFTSRTWLARCQQVLGEGTRTGMLATAAAITDTPAERADFALRTGAVAVDMETEFIAHACSEASVQMVSLRAISDTPAAPLPAPPAVLFYVESQKTNYGRLARHVAQHPGSAVRLYAFARQIATARESLGASLMMLVRNAL